MEDEGDNYINRDWCFWYSQQVIIKESGKLEVKGQVDTIQTKSQTRKPGCG